MIRTSLLLPESLKKAAERAASARGLSLAGLIRQQLEAVVGGAGQERAADPMFAQHAPFRGSTDATLSERHDDLLYGDDP